MFVDFSSTDGRATKNIICVFIAKIFFLSFEPFHAAIYYIPLKNHNKRLFRSLQAKLFHGNEKGLIGSSLVVLLTATCWQSWR